MSSDQPEHTPIPIHHSHPLVTENDHTSLLNVLGWFSASVIVLIVLTRLGTRRAKSRTVGLDDGAIIVAAIVAVAQTATVSIGVSHGLGRMTGEESRSQMQAQLKSIYAFTILFIVGQFFAKISIVFFVVALTPDRTYRSMSLALAAGAAIWMITSTFGFAFGCELPEPWNFVEQKCIDRLSFYAFVEVFNIILDALLAVYPSYLIFGLHLETKRKVITIGFFMSRILVVAASITQLIVIYTHPDDPFLSWSFALLVTIIQTFGIVTACGPYLKPFLDSINSGMIGNDDIRRRAGGTVSEYTTEQGSKGSRQSKQSKASKKSGRTLFSGRKKDTPWFTGESELATVKSDQIRSEGHKTQIESLQGGEKWEAGSQSSRTRIIRKTTTYMVSPGT